MKYIFLLIFMVAFLVNQNAFAWGGRGHDAICQSAVFLVKEKGLKNFLMHRPHVMGYLCNLPDVYWKSIGKDVSEVGNPTHFIDPEILGLKPADVPLDYATIINDYTGKPNKFKNDGSVISSVPHDLGSLWWRADQFVRRVGNLEKDFTAAKLPINHEEEYDENIAYNKTVYSMMVNLGLMGHFSGDVSQPFHTTADYDGFRSGHGGVHGYYEDAIVAEFDGDLQNKILNQARHMKKTDFLKGTNVVEKMRALSAISLDEVKKIVALDPITKKSEGKEYAKRKPARVGFDLMSKMIVKDMARGALLTANLWDEAYVRAGRPNLSKYRSFKFPYTVDFIKPDYTETPITK